jgi:glycine/D-amino acid oxidase-like deaminating enzyme
VATEPLSDALWEEIGWGTRTPFYTIDLPYLWGRVTADGRTVIGSGITGRHNVENARADEAASQFDDLRRRIQGLHPAMHNVRLTHRWMGPICFTSDGKPIVTSQCADRVLIATGYSGHGVALSVRVGRLLAEVIAGRSELPEWSRRP